MSDNTVDTISTVHRRLTNDDNQHIRWYTTIRQSEQSNNAARCYNIRYDISKKYNQHTDAATFDASDISTSTTQRDMIDDTFTVDTLTIVHKM